MSEFRSETSSVYGRPDLGPLPQLDLSPETLERLGHLKALKSPQTTRRPIPESEIQAMLEQRRAGASEPQIARDFHRSVKRVKAVMLEHAVQIIGFIPASRVAELFRVRLATIFFKRFQRLWGLDKISRAWNRRELLWDEAQVLECVKGRFEHKTDGARVSNTTYHRRKPAAVEARIVSHLKLEGTATRLELDLTLRVSGTKLGTALETLCVNGLIVRSDHDCTVWKLSRKALEGTET